MSNEFLGDAAGALRWARRGHLQVVRSSSNEVGDGAGESLVSGGVHPSLMPKRMGHGIELLADETRRSIIALLAIHPRRPSTMAQELGLSRSTMTHHLHLLESAGLIRVLRVFTDGRYVLYGIEPNAHGRITAWLAGTGIGVVERPDVSTAME